MIPDIKLKEYYLRYVYNAKRDIEKYKELLTSIINTKQELYEVVNKYYDELNDKFNLNLKDYDIEWNQMKYNIDETLYKTILRLLKVIEEEDRIKMIQVIKYCVKLKEEYETHKLIYIAERRKDLSLKDYKYYINKYYTAVHKAVLEGYGYRFHKGIGTFIINYYKIDNPTKMKIDYAETNKRKKELIEKGLKPYDDREADWYKARHLPYDGVEYRVYLDKKFIYDITFVDSRIFHKKELEYQRIEYVHLKLRGLSYQEMADKYCKTFDDIIELNVDLRYKLNIFLYKYPEKYLNFVRNAEQSKYKY